jgi:hypothetical protein
VVTTAAAHDYLDNVCTQLTSLADDAVRVRILSTELDTLTAVTLELGRLRRDAIQRMRAGMTVQQISDAIGLSRSRIYALLGD